MRHMTAKMGSLFMSMLLNSIVIHAFPIFTFNGTSDSSATPSFASLVNDVDLPDIFILCSSSKQARFDDVGFYSIAGKDSGAWLTIQFHPHTKAIRLLVPWDGKFHIGGELENPMLDFWYHMCLRIDLTTNEIEIAVNGAVMGKIVDKKITNIPSKLRMEIGIDHKNQQFQGSVSNVQVFKEGNITEISAEPCKQRQNTILPWSPNSWRVVGSEWSSVEEFEDMLCLPSDHYILAIPSKMTINESMDTCNLKLNNSIIPFQNDQETFKKYVAWYKNTTGGTCHDVWTPLSDENSEGTFLNMNNNVSAKFQPWNEGEPNGGKIENFAWFRVSTGMLDDVGYNRLACSSCLISKSLLLQLDGLCEDSLIGNLYQIDMYIK